MDAEIIIKWGFIGCGEVTEKKSGPAFSLVPGSKIEAVVSRNKEKAGRIVFDGKPYPYKKRRELCYMTMQDVVHQLFSDSVWEEFSLLNKTVDEQEITKILRRLDLFDYKDKHPMTLSGGQKQRLALAVATLANKDIMIFDEPTSGLDYGNMIKVCELIKELSSNRIVFVATHDRELMGLLCTRRMEISNESISVYDLTTK